MRSSVQPFAAGRVETVEAEGSGSVEQKQEP
jgi:hypothetical protein